MSEQFEGKVAVVTGGSDMGHATRDMVLRYSRYIDIEKALAGHQRFNPLDRLMQGDNHNRGDDG